MMTRKPRPAEDVVPVALTLHLKAHIVRDFEEMSRNTKKPVDELVETALKMFIATHNDYLRRNKVP